MIRELLAFYKEVKIMKSMRRFGLVLIVLFLGIIIGNFGLRTALLVFVPLFYIVVYVVG